MPLKSTWTKGLHEEPIIPDMQTASGCRCSRKKRGQRTTMTKMHQNATLAYKDFNSFKLSFKSFNGMLMK